MEECIFFENGSYRLFGCLHPAVSESTSIGIVVCAPFAEEKLWSHRLFVNLARYLSNMGISVLRFDYMGHGDSSGNFEDGDIQTRISDIECAIDLLRTHMHIGKIGLLGLRLGATLAAKVAERNPKIGFLMLWEPVINVEKYVLQCLRSNLATQLATYKQINYTREKLLSDFESGKSVNIDGYMVSPQFYHQAIEINLNNTTLHFPNPVQIVHISKSLKGQMNKEMDALCKSYQKCSQTVTVDIVIEKPFWSDIKIYLQKSNPLFDVSRAFIHRSIPEID